MEKINRLFCLLEMLKKNFNAKKMIERMADSERCFSAVKNNDGSVKRPPWMERSVAASCHESETEISDTSSITPTKPGRKSLTFHINCSAKGRPNQTITDKLEKELELRRSLTKKWE